MIALRTALLPVFALAVIAAAPLAGLGKYVGAYPFDKRGGTTFLADPRVRQAVVRHAPLALQKTLLSAGVAGPITRAAGAILSNGCEPHNCGAHSWAILISPDGTRAAICHADWDVAEQGVWYQNRVRIGVQPDGSCPGEAQLIPDAVLKSVASPARPVTTSPRRVR
jgi:hypothetical protein